LTICCATIPDDRPEAHPSAVAVCTNTRRFDPEQNRPGGIQQQAVLDQELWRALPRGKDCQDDLVYFDQAEGLEIRLVRRSCE
jgi:hypothetical protein